MEQTPAQPTPPKLEHYTYLWDGSAPEWILLAGTDAERGILSKLSIYNCVTRHVLLIEAPELAEQVMQAMLERGAIVLTTQDIRT